MTTPTPEQELVDLRRIAEAATPGRATWVNRPSAIKGRMSMADVEIARERLDYNPETGEFHWSKPVFHFKAGARAGKTHGAGYRYIRVCGRDLAAHRLAWAFVHGRLPVQQIDHINGDKQDNRIANLREVSQVENMRARRTQPRNATGSEGVSYRYGRWRAAIQQSGRRMHLGTFDTLEQARGAYEAARSRVIEDANWKLRAEIAEEEVALLTKRCKDLDRRLSEFDACARTSKEGAGS